MAIFRFLNDDDMIDCQSNLTVVLCNSLELEILTHGRQLKDGNERKEHFKCIGKC